MVVFRIAGANELTEDLLKRLNKQGLVHMVPASLKGKYVIRFTVTSQFTTEEDIERDWRVITDMAKLVLEEGLPQEEESIDEKDEDDENGEGKMVTSMEPFSETMQENGSGLQKDVVVSLNGDTVVKKHPGQHLTSLPKPICVKRRDYGISLLLSNVPMSPKVVNGSYAALFDGGHAGLEQLARQLTVGGEFIRLSPRKRGRLGDFDKQMSLDYSVLGNRRDNPFRMKMMGSLDSKIDDILDLGSKATQTERENIKADTADWKDGTSNVNEVKMAFSNEGRILEQEHWDTGHENWGEGAINGAGSATSGKCKIETVRWDKDMNGKVNTKIKEFDDVKLKYIDGEGSARAKPGRSVVEISKAVCSKVKDVFFTFPGGSPTTTPSKKVNHLSTVALGAPTEHGEKLYCKYCGHVLGSQANGRPGQPTAVKAED
ncbi:unnamed protein product [Lymnaea stagnalis]